MEKQALLSIFEVASESDPLKLEARRLETGPCVGQSLISKPHAAAAPHSADFKAGRTCQPLSISLGSDSQKDCGALGRLVHYDANAPRLISEVYSIPLTTNIELAFI